MKRSLCSIGVNLTGSRIISIVVIFLILLLSLINSNKYFESDLYVYSSQYQQAVGSNLVVYLSVVGKDPLFYLMHFLFSNYISINFRVYIFIFSIISYSGLTLFYSRFLRLLGVKSTLIGACVVTMLFFPQIFLYSGHVMRQFLALSWGYLGLVLLLYNRRLMGSLLLFSSILTHSSSAIIILAFFLITEFSTYWKALVLTLPLGFFLYPYFSSFLKGFERLNSLNSGAAELEPAGVFSVGVVIVFLYLSVYWIKDKMIAKNFLFVPKMNIVLALIFFSFRFVGNHEVANRMMLGMFIIWPIILLYMLREFRATSLYKVIIPILFLYLLRSVLNGPWTYL